MAPRYRLLLFSIGTGAAFAYAMIGASATGIAKKDAAKAEVGSCAAYSGLPTDLRTLRGWMGFGSIVMR